MPMDVTKRLGLTALEPVRFAMDQVLAPKFLQMIPLAERLIVMVSIPPAGTTTI